jgi:hypothetical protein
MRRFKYWCEACDLVFKAREGALCPSCREPMRNMGPKWRVGKKGHRVDWIETPPEDRFYWAPLQEHLKLLGKIVFDKKRGTWVYERTYKNRKRS